MRVLLACNQLLSCCVFRWQREGGREGGREVGREHSAVFPSCCYLVSKSCLTLCNPVHCSSAGSPVHEILQARIPEWGCHALLRRIFPTQGSNLSLLHYRWVLYHWAAREAPLSSYKDINPIMKVWPQSIQLLSHVQLFATPWTTARQASLSITNSWSLLRLTSIELVMPSNHHLNQPNYLWRLHLQTPTHWGLMFQNMRKGRTQHILIHSRSVLSNRTSAGTEMF